MFPMEFMRAKDSADYLENRASKVKRFQFQLQNRCKRG